MGGTNTRENIVKLTAKEHFVVHHLLTKLYPNNRKLLFAYACFLAINKHHIGRSTPRSYERLKKIKSELQSGVNNFNYGNKSGGATGRHHSDATKKILAEQKLGKKRKPFTRRPASEETKQKISLAKKGKPISIEHRNNISAARLRRESAKH